MSEKSVHNSIKHYLEPDKTKHEVRIGPYIADILTDTKIYEIQSKNFGLLLDKLYYYIENTDKEIVIVYPACIKKILYWVNKDTNEVEDIRRRSINGGKYAVFNELYRLKELIHSPRISIIVLLIEVGEFKYLDGYGSNKKRNATKIDKIPLKIVDKIEFSAVNNSYKQFLNVDLPKQFNSTDFAKASKCGRDCSSVTLLTLYRLGYVNRVGRDKQGIIYEINEGM